MNTVRRPQTADKKPGPVAYGCALIVMVGIAAAVITPVVWFFMKVYDRASTDDPPPFKADQVEQVTKRPTTFDDSVSPYDHERPQGENEPLGLNRVKDDIYRNFFPKLGDADAKVAIDCGDAKLEDGDFECVASHDDVKVTYWVVISGLRLPQAPLLPGGSTGLATWEQDVIPRKAPLFRDAVHTRIWEQAQSHKEEATGVACDRMPEVSLLAPGTVTKYRCYFKYKLGLNREWVTYRVALNKTGDVSLSLVYDDEAK
ncbi:hypothetical protein [Streptomyces ipomoeae]|uniref:hypothetical protein n=1 Tax=Streptomyces ipomoeae TaxID=103232 RepID=UPI00114654ED|nr:hypothetical protein [Streptomyces ipomoeae]MDX2935380.1 hypothetical protein [Streptomyces ipomoeae]TQE19976.1 hypothetical protein SipoB123_30030 [Streptomyces ipomoeae]